MLPVLLDLQVIKIYTQGVFLVLAFFWGMFFLWKNILLTSYKEEDIFDALFVSLLGGLFFGRLLHVILHFDTFGFDILKFILMNGYPGLSFIGGIVGGFVTLYLYLTAHKMKFSKVMDYAAAPILLALGIGKIGAFFAGSEIGTKTTFFLAVKYTNFDGLRHLTPFYEGILLLIGSFIAYKLLFSIRRGILEDGFNFVFTVGYLSFVYLVFDIIKLDRVMVFGYSFNMMVSAIMLLTVTLYVLYYFRAAMSEKIARIKR